MESVGECKVLLAAHELARIRITERRKSTFVPFKTGDKVWLDTQNLKTNHHKKIGPKREGPFEITKVIGPVTYQLQLPGTWKIHNVFHTTLLRQYKETKVYGANFPKPPPELIEGEEVYEVENCYEFLSFFVSLNVSFHHAVLSFVGLIHASSIVLSFVLSFVLHIVSLPFHTSFQLFICINIKYI